MKEITLINRKSPVNLVFLSLDEVSEYAPAYEKQYLNDKEVVFILSGDKVSCIVHSLKIMRMAGMKITPGVLEMSVSGHAWEAYKLMTGIPCL